MSAPHASPAPSESAVASGESSPGELIGGQRADRGHGHQDVEDRGDHQRADDRNRQVALRVVGLLASRRDRVEADVGEEDQRRRGLDAAKAIRGEVGEMVSVERRGGHDDEEHQDRQLGDDHHRVRARRLAHSGDQQRGHREHEQEGGHVHVSAVAGRQGDRVAEGDPEERVEQRREVGAPSHGHGRHRHAVLEDQVPPDDPREDLAHRRVGVRIGRARHRKRRRELRVGEGREDAGDAGEQERDHERRPGLGDGLADDHEDPGADDRADAQRGQVEGADGPVEPRSLGSLDELLGGLGRKGPGTRSGRHCAPLPKPSSFRPPGSRYVQRGRK